MKRASLLAKIIVIASMLCLLGTTFVLRAKILTLVNFLMTGQDIVATERMDRFHAAEDDRQSEYVAALARFEIGMEQYRSLLQLYQDDLDAYRKRTNEGRMTQPPPIPEKPRLPRTPEVQRTLAEINSNFRDARNSYFRFATALNGFVAVCALLLIGGLLFLMFFDASNGRLMYIVVLAISFVFIIGPAFHSALTFAAYQLNPPSYVEQSYGYRGY